MIYFNGIELDYDSKTLNKIVIKKALSDIESLADRKGTSSTTFDVPRTAHNEKAFKNMTVEGSEFTSVGTGSIYLDGNEHSRGKIYIRGYNDTTFKCVFMGEDSNFIKDLKVLEMSDLIEENASDGFLNATLIYSSLGFKAKAATVTSAQLDFIISQPNIIRKTTQVEKFAAVADPLAIPYLRPDNMAPFFSIKNIMENMIEKQGYTLSSTFFDSDYGSNLVYSTYEGKHKATNYFLDATTSGTSLDYSMDIGSNLHGYMPTKSYAFELDRDCEEVNIRFHLNLANDSKVKKTTLQVITFSDEIPSTTDGDPPVSDGVWEIIGVSNAIVLKEGNNVLDLELKPLITFANGDYFQLKIINELKSGESLPITQTLDLTHTAVSYDTIKSGDFCYLGDYLGPDTQFDFFKNILKQFNLNMLIEDTKIVLELADYGYTPNDEVSIPGIVTSNIDITNRIKSNIDVSISTKPNSNVHMKQPYLDSPSIIEAGKGVTAFGSYDYDLDTFGTTTDKIDSGFNTVYDVFGDYKFFLNADHDINATTYVEEWENLIGCWWNTLIKDRDSNTTYNTEGYNNIYGHEQTYRHIDGTIHNSATVGGTYGIDMPVINFKITRFADTAETLFLKTLEQKKNNKVREIELYDYTGNLITFRSDYIIDNQIYKLLSYEFEPISKLVKAKIILK